MAEDNENEEQAEGGGKKKILMLAIVGALLVVLSVGGTLLALTLLGDDEKPEDPEMMEGQDAEGVAPASNVAIYYPLKPALRTNVPHRGGYRLVEIEVSIMSRSNAVISEVETHKASINNNLLMLIMRQSFDDMMTAEGKELFRQQALAEVRKILEIEAGVTEGVEQVLLTEFKMQ
ncbi:MAG: flagellar basal body-associated FliL family protein [Cellvibrionaceae bacterium]